MTLSTLTTTILLGIGISACAQSNADTVQLHYDVLAQANVFYHGIMQPNKVPGGAGIEPITVDVRGVQYIRIQEATGTVSPFSDRDSTMSGADGGEYGLKTAVSGAGAFAGIQHDKRAMFLCGIFTSYASGLDQAYPATDYTNDDNKPQYWPALNQTFIIGDGKTDKGQEQIFKVPNEAETLYIGFADCLEGSPSNYRDNQGYITITLILEQKKK